MSSKEHVNHEQQVPAISSSSILYKIHSNKKIWNALTVLSLSFMTGNSVHALIRVYLNENCSTSTFTFFAFYLFFMTALGFCTALDRSPSPWHREPRQKDFFLGVTWLICISLNLVLAIKFAPLLGSLALWFILTLAFVVIILSFYLFFMWDHKDPTSSVVSGKQNKNLDFPSPGEKVQPVYKLPL